jgi:hypothetical protein
VVLLDAAIGNLPAFTDTFVFLLAVAYFQFKEASLASPNQFPSILTLPASSRHTPFVSG